MSFQGLHWLQKLGSCKALFGVKVHGLIQGFPNFLWPCTPSAFG